VAADRETSPPGGPLAPTPQDEQRLALFIDFENIAIGVRDAHYRKFDINLVLERLLDKGKLLVKRAYADWSRYSDYKRSFHEAAIELIEVPQKSIGGKNSADIRLVVDAMDMSFQKEHINCFVIASGDSDFSPLVSKLKENNKYVIGLGVKDSTSDLLMENCDEFIFYEDIVRVQERPLPAIANVSDKLRECFGLLVDSIHALQRENKETLWGSMVKETMKRKKPSFNEGYYGFRTFSHLLEDAQRRGIVTLRRDQRSGSYTIEDLGAGVGSGAATPTIPMQTYRPAPAEGRSGEARAAEGSPAAASSASGEGETNGATPRPSRRRRGRGRRGRGSATEAQVAGEVGSPETMESEGEETDEADDLGADETGLEGASEGEGASSGERQELSSQEDDSSATGHDEAQDRGPFSFFSSWLRRPQPPVSHDHAPGADHAEANAAEPQPPPPPKDDEPQP
jgi:uncharacterized LabA/DUF88 family protein